MIGIDAAWLATAPLDMRAGTDTALARVIATFGAAHPHHAYVFANQRANRLKRLVHVCSAVGHAKAMPLTRRGLDKDCVPVAGYVYCNPEQRGDRMVRVSHWGGLLRKSAIQRMLAAGSG